MRNNMISMFTFYRGKHFKETPIGKIPEDWKIKKLENLAVDIYYGITAKAVERKTNLKMLRTTDIKDYSIDWDNLPFCEITEKKSKLSKYFLKKGDLIVARAGTAGVSVLVEGDFDKVIFGSYLIKIRLKNEVLPKYIHYFFQSDIYWYHIISNQAGSTLKNINLPILRSLKIPIPSSLQEQKAIVHILSTIDEAIQKTNEIIEKIKRLKRGLMQELLTKGIGHKEFKNTEIGRMPKEWKVVKIGNVLSLEYGKGLPERKRVPGSYPVVGSNGIVGYHNQALVKGPGIVVGRKGTIGAVTWIDSDFWPIDTTYYVKTKTSKVSLKWLFYELTYLNPARFRLADVVPGLKRELVHALKMPFPPLPEQEKIAEILLTVDKMLEVERKKRERLKRIKKAIMNLLLTGKIRVKVR